MLGHNGELNYSRNGGASWLNIPGVLSVEVPRNSLDEHVSVIKIDLEGSLDLYHGAGAEVESN